MCIANTAIRCSVIVLMSISAPLSVQAASLTPIGTFQVMGLSSDGTTVIGQARRATGWEAVRWQSATGETGLGDLPGGIYSSDALAVSADGSVVVGSGNAVSGSQAYVWTPSTGMVNIGDLPGGTPFSIALGISDDGATVVGVSSSTAGSQAFRWKSADGMVGLGDLPGGGFGSSASAISANGHVIVGTGNSALSSNEAFRWTQDSGMVGIGVLPGEFRSLARAVSDDGAVIVGETAFSAFRWTAVSGINRIDVPAGALGSSGTVDLSSDGSIVLGWADTSDNFVFFPGEAFLWTEVTGSQWLTDVLIARGVQGIAGWHLTAAGISADGRWVAGNATTPSGQTMAYIADLAVVPIPAPAWLLGSALGMLIAARHCRS